LNATSENDKNEGNVEDRVLDPFQEIRFVASLKMGQCSSAGWMSRPIPCTVEVTGRGEASSLIDKEENERRR